MSRSITAAAVLALPITALVSARIADDELAAELLSPWECIRGLAAGDEDVFGLLGEGRVLVRYSGSGGELEVVP